MPEYATDIDDGIFEYSDYGNCVFRPNLKWVDRKREDIIWFNEDNDAEELKKGLEIGSSINTNLRNSIIDIVKTYWDCFCKEGARRTILDYEFAIDTSTSKPVCCKKPAYGPHESTIIMKQVQQLLANGWIKRCQGPWGSLIVLAAKPHQEHVTNIDNFIWRMCVSYHKLN